MTNKHKTFDLELILFAGLIIDTVESLPNTRVGNHIANQLIRSGTSPAANYSEALSAESRKDFIHKIKISLKELRETRVWLKIIKSKQLVRSVDSIDSIISENEELIRIFASSLRTAETCS